MEGCWKVPSPTTIYYDKVRISALKNDVGGRWLVDDRGAAEMLPEEWNYGARLRLGVTILPSISPNDEPGLPAVCSGWSCLQADHGSPRLARNVLRKCGA